MSKKKNKKKSCSSKFKFDGRKCNLIKNVDMNLKVQ